MWRNMRMQTVVIALALVSVGCSSTAREQRDAGQIIAKDLARSGATTVPFDDAITPMLGYWVSDVHATLKANPQVSREEREFIKRDLETYPFELQITRGTYISRS